jgi:hypothetical protein
MVNEEHKGGTYFHSGRLECRYINFAQFDSISDLLQSTW